MHSETTYIYPMRYYPGKLLLFGEYVLLLGESALAVPVEAFGGKWETGTEPDPQLMRFAASETVNALPGYDFERLRTEITAGLYFHSNIPHGYGLGSSGALCAAVYDRFAREKTDDPAELKTILAAMECYFHKTSSGLDPLTSYLAQPVLMQNGLPTVLDAAQLPQMHIQTFLLDTGLPRQTGPLVNWFLEKSQTTTYSHALNLLLRPAHQNTLKAWLAGNQKDFWQAVRALSAAQLELMQPMIPENFRELWKIFLEKENIALKLCGAGGGGFLLGFALPEIAVEQVCAPYRILFPLRAATYETPPA